MTRRLVLVIFFLEVGFVLIMAPWSAYWDRNYFAETVPAVRTFITNNFLRGAITGVGILNVAAALFELLSIFVGRQARSDEADLALAESYPAKD